MVVSILVPLYNGVEFLDECLKSVVSQTFEDWELWIAVNGHGSTGGEVAEKARALTHAMASGNKERIHVVVQGPDVVGKVASLNAIVPQTRGEWICILDVDDVWHPEKLQKQVDARGTEARDAAVIGTACKYFGEMQHIPALKYGMLGFQDFLTANQVINSSAMIHRSLAVWRDKYAGLENAGMEDYDMWFRITLAGGKIYNIPEVLVYHRVHRTSAFNSKNQDPRPLQDLFRNLQVQM